MEMEKDKKQVLERTEMRKGKIVFANTEQIIRISWIGAKGHMVVVFIRSG